MKYFRQKLVNVAFFIFIAMLIIPSALAGTISSCDDDPVIEDEVYTLTQNIIATSAQSTCLTVGANNVTIDCQGYKITFRSYGIINHNGSSYYDMVTVKNCVIALYSISSTSYPISFTQSYNSTIVNNKITASKAPGIRLSDSDFNNISYNNITQDNGNNVYGIYLTAGSDNNTVSNNRITMTSGSNYNQYGMVLEISDDNKISNNTVSTGTYGSYAFFLTSSTGNNLTGNAATTTNVNSYVVIGTTSSDFENYISTSNLAEGLPVNYTANGQDLIFDSIDFTQYGQVIFGGGSNITVRNSNFTADSINFFTTKNSSIIGNNISTSTGTGIFLYNKASNNTIKGNTVDSTVSSNYGYGIALFSNSNSNFVFNNTLSTVSGAGHGIYVITGRNNTVQANDVLILGSQASGIFLRESSHYNHISGNHVSTSDFSCNGIYLATSDNNTLDNNTIITSGNKAYGVFLLNSRNNTLTNNKANTSNTISYMMSAADHLDYYNSIGQSNFAEGSPVNISFDQHNLFFDNVDFAQYGQVTFLFADNITITNSNFSGDSLSLFNTANSSFSYNHINTSAGFGIYLTLESSDNRIHSNMINTSGGYGRGIFAEDDSDRLNITNNVIMTQGDNAYAIGFDTGLNDCIISHNMINTSGTSSYGIFMNTHQDSQIFNNSISTSGQSGIGIYLYTTCNRQKIYNNTIRTNNSNADGISLTKSLNNEIYNTTITVANAKGINIVSNSNNNIFRNIRVTSESSAISLSSGSNNNTFSNMQVISTGSLPAAAALYLYSSSHNFVFSDSILDSTFGSRPELVAASVSPVTSGTWNFTNVTRSDGTPIEVKWASTSGNLNMNWYMDIKVTNSSADLENAALLSYDNQSNPAFSESTPSDGFVRKALLEYKRSGSGGLTYDFKSPYNLSISLPGYPVYKNFSINLSNNRAFNINLACFCPIRQNYTVRDICHFSGLKCYMPDYTLTCRDIGTMTLDNSGTFVAKRMVTPINHTCLVVDDTSNFYIVPP